MSPTRLQEHWHHQGHEDPMFAVLTDPAKEGRKRNRDEFYASGREAVADAFRWLECENVAVSRGAALDFGCGAGRLSRALAEEFETVIDVNIALSMVAVARESNTEPERVEFILNDSTRQPFDDRSFDLVHTYYLLQHIETVYATAYVAEFVRIPRPGDDALFQFTIAPIAPIKRFIAGTMLRFMVRAYMRIRFGRHYMEMHGIPPQTIGSLVRASGARVVSMETVPGHRNWRSHICCAVKE